MFALAFFSLNTRADIFDWFVVLDATNGFYASPGVPEPAIVALKEAQSENVEIKSFAFTPGGDWLLLENKGFKSSDDSLGICKMLHKSDNKFEEVNCAAITHTGNGRVISYKNGDRAGEGDGPGAAWKKLGNLPREGHKIRSVSYGTEDSWVILYDQTGICYGGIPAKLAGILDNAVSNNIPIHCVAFSGRDWICLANDTWWSSNPNLPASKFIDQSYRSGQHPKWIAFVPNEGSLDGDFHLEYIKSHRVTYTKNWTFQFPNYVSKRWLIAMCYQPATAWSRDIKCTGALLTSAGWKPFQTSYENSPEKRPIWIIDYPHDDPLLKSGFKIQTTMTATVYEQKLVSGPPSAPVLPLTQAQRQAYLAPTESYDFNKDSVKQWITQHNLWITNGESRQNFVRRVYRELRKTLPYSTADGGRWICSQIMKVGFGECCRHSVVGTSILRANGIPARMICAGWADDDNSQGGHCWGEFYWEGVGWVTYDTTVGSKKKPTDAYFGNKEAHWIPQMVDQDYIIDAGTFGRRTAFGLDAWPIHWSEGEGSLDGEKCVGTSSIKVIERYK